ncbi:MAG: type II toxin-antitoxin system RelE/ParE family toxin [Ruminococcaceae bacterium]|nr:type II toxin-antitoxin system RelE/ParE family toxin [Oscillospiraceae bacterium]
MYKLEFLPIAKDDMLEIIKYNAKDLKNSVAAERLAEEFITSADRICEFPYSNSVYTPIKPLETEYRRIIVNNYLMFYTVDEGKKTVTIMRVIYAKRNIEKQL